MLLRLNMGIFYKKKHNQFNRNRKDALRGMNEVKGRRWTAEEDQLLSETVLHTISQGGTQLTAFSDVGKKISRTAGACGFRWNAVLRSQNPTSYSEAKKKRVYTQLEKKRKSKVETFSEAIELLKRTEQAWVKQQKEISRLTQSISQTKQKVNTIRQENQKCKQENNSVEWVQQEVKNRYEELVSLIEQLKKETAVGGSESFLPKNIVGKTNSVSST
jgi:prespore-specific regulator